MAFNGSGTFVRLYNWVQDAANNINIVPTRHDNEDDGFATALTDCITRDGQSPATANLPMGGFAHTNVADGATRTQYASIGQLQDGALSYSAASGSANAYTLALSLAIPAYVAGQRFTFQANFLNTGAATLNINSLGAKNIKIEGLFDLPPYAIKNGQTIEVEYDGTSFQPLNLNNITGTIEMWLSSTPKPGYLVCDGTTSIGDATSGATVANAYTEGLYRYLWDSVSNTYAPVATGRGVSASADFAAHKKITLPSTKDMSPYGIGTTITSAMATSGASTVMATGSVGTSGSTAADLQAHTHTWAMKNTSANANYPTGIAFAGMAGGGTSLFQTNAADTTVSFGINSTGTGGGHVHTAGVLTMNAASVLHPVFGCYFIIKI